MAQLGGSKTGNVGRRLFLGRAYVGGKQGGRFHFLIFPLSVLLGFGIAALTVENAAGEGLVTEENLRDAILGRNSISESDAATMDMNEDGRLDAGDLVYFLRNQGAVPKASFKATLVNAFEGGSDVLLEVIFTSKFTGTLNYIVDNASLATAGEDFTALAGSVAVNGFEAEIPVRILDDMTVENTETIEIRLLAGNGYVVGSPSDCTVYIEDNDAVWKGVVTRQLTSGLGFDLVILRAGGVAQAFLRGDGTGIIPESDPPGQGWPAQAITVTDTTFNLRIEGIPVPDAYTSRLATRFTRTFEFYYRTPEKDTVIDTLTEFAGSVVERLVPENMAFAHLATQVENGFMLKKVPGDVDVPEAPLVDAK